MKKKLTTLELIKNIQHGVTIFNDRLELVESNDKFLTIMDFPEKLSKPGTPFIEFLRFNAKRGLYGEGDWEELAQTYLDDIIKNNSHIYDRTLEDGNIVHVHGTFTDEGWLVTTYTDVTAIRGAEQVRQILVREKQSEIEKVEKAELEINQRNRTLEAITENTKHGISLFDIELNLVASNSRFFELMEFPETYKKPGINLKEFFYYNARRGEYGDGNIDEQVAERIALAKTFRAHKFERVRPNGTVIEVIGTPIAEGFVTTYTDITELRQTQYKLEEATKNLQVKVDEQTREIREKQERSLQLITAFDALRESVALVDENDRFVFINRRYKEINKDVSEMLVPGTLFEDYITATVDAGLIPEAIGQEKAWLEKRMDQHRNPSGSFESYRHTGLWLLVSEQKLEQGGTIMLATDITERKKAEEALRENEELLRATAENLPEVFWISKVDSETKYSMQYVNPAFEKIWQRKREELYKDPSVWFSCMHPEDKERVATAAEDFYHEKRPYSEEFRIIPPDGMEKIIHITGNLIKDKTGKITGAAGISRDITHQKQMEEQLRRSQKMDAVGQITGGIAHDFNNILGIIQGNLELLDDIIVDHEKAERRIEMALKGVERGVDITKKLLGFSSKDAQQITLTSVNDYIENLETLIAKSLTASVKVKTLLANNLWKIAIDPGDFEDAVLNLSLNARDAMPEGGTLTLETSNKVLDADYVRRNPTVKLGDYVMVSIRDTGEGFSKEIKDKIFEPFFTTKELGKGTGLGLSMVYGFIQRSGGHISVHSDIGVGTIFRLYLPRSHELTLGLKPQSADHIDLPKGTETVLVVDDEEALRNIATLHLKNLGYDVLVAANSKEALTLLNDTNAIDLLFSDVVMPGQLNGYQLADAAHKVNPDLDILLTSGFTKVQEMTIYSENEYLSSLIESMLNKPYNKSQLAFSIRKTLDTTR
ncbi:MAG: PAS-domain containing protein [Sneathiella sp.]|nr:PAS-domain containing protein [Sneathiella sp.]